MGRPPKFQTPEDLTALAEEYFDLCDKENPPTVNGLCLWLDICRDTLWEYSKKPDFSDAVKRVRMQLEAAWESRLAGNNVAGTIFWLKNQGWSDKTEQAVTVDATVSTVERRIVRPAD